MIVKISFYVSEKDAQDRAIQKMYGILTDVLNEYAFHVISKNEFLNSISSSDYFIGILSQNSIKDIKWFLKQLEKKGIFEKEKSKVYLFYYDDCMSHFPSKYDQLNYFQLENEYLKIHEALIGEGKIDVGRIEDTKGIDKEISFILKDYEIGKAIYKKMEIEFTKAIEQIGRIQKEPAKESEGIQVLPPGELPVKDEAAANVDVAFRRQAKAKPDRDRDRMEREIARDRMEKEIAEKELEQMENERKRIEEGRKRIFTEDELDHITIEEADLENEKNFDREVLVNEPLLMVSTPKVQSLKCHTYKQGDDEQAKLSFNYIQPKVDYNTAIRIGRHEGAYINANIPFPVETLKKEYPTEELPHGKKGWTLHVVYHILDSKSEPQIGSILLPENEDSTSAVFSFTSPENNPIFTARIVVLYKNRVLQIARYEIPVCSNAEEYRKLNRPHCIFVESAQQYALSDLEGKDGFDTALIIHRDRTGNPKLLGIKDEIVKEIPLTNIQQQVILISDEITSLVAKDYTLPLNSDIGRSLLFTLAHNGRIMKREIDDSFKGYDIAHAKRLQLTEVHDGSITPLEFCYNRYAPSDDAVICPDAIRALQKGSCDQCPVENTMDEKKRICPLGFWSLNKVLERHRVDTSKEENKGYICFNPDENSIRQNLHPFLSALIGTSDKANLVDKDVTKVLDNKIKEIIPSEKVFHAADWNTWAEFIKKEAPTLLVLLVHTEKKGSDALPPAMEIGNGQFLRSSEIEKYIIRNEDESKNKPIVLLIGCNTAVADILNQSFVSLILKSNASIVLGTITKNSGRHGGQLIMDFLEALKDESKQKPISFGEVLLRIRQKFLADNKLISLSLVSFGDADYQISQ